MPPLPPVTKALMLICVAVFCIDKLMASTGVVVLTPAGVMSHLEGLFALWPLTTTLFWPWQLLSYAFLHGDVWHLFFNMLGLWMFGSELELLWGQRRYLMLMLVSVLAAALMQLIITAIGASRVPTVGASGALFGLLLAYGTYFPNRVIMPLFPPIPMKARTFVIVFGALELLLGLGSRDGIAHFAHLGGMLGAFLMIRYWRGQPPFKRSRR